MHAADLELTYYGRNEGRRTQNRTRMRSLAKPSPLPTELPLGFAQQAKRRAPTGYMVRACPFAAVACAAHPHKAELAARRSRAFFAKPHPLILRPPARQPAPTINYRPSLPSTQWGVDCTEDGAWDVIASPIAHIFFPCPTLARELEVPPEAGGPRLTTLLTRLSAPRPVGSSSSRNSRPRTRGRPPLPPRQRQRTRRR